MTSSAGQPQPRTARARFVTAGVAAVVLGATVACASTADKAASKWPGLYGSTWTLAEDKVGDIDPADVGGSAYSVSIGERLIVTVVDGERNQKNTSDVLDTLANSEIARNASGCRPPKEAPDQCWVTYATNLIVTVPDSVVRHGDWIEVTADDRRAAFIRSGPAAEPTHATNSPEM